jgi:hypothetical protein
MGHDELSDGGVKCEAIDTISDRLWANGTERKL